MLMRALTLGVWVEGTQVFLLLIPVVLGIVCLGAFLFMR
jgi:hypothetical protein